MKKIIYGVLIVLMFLSVGYADINMDISHAVRRSNSNEVTKILKRKPRLTTFTKNRLLQYAVINKDLPMVKLLYRYLRYSPKNLTKSMASSYDYRVAKFLIAHGGKLTRDRKRNT